MTINDLIERLREPIIADAMAAGGITNGILAERIINERGEAAAALTEAAEREPVAWRVKDFADGWILFHTEAEARHEASGAGNLVQPLYAVRWLRAEAVRK